MPKLPDTIKAGRTTGSQRDSIKQFVSSGIEGIYEFGIDHLSVSKVSRNTSASRPTFYSYFGNMSGLYAEIWLERGRAFLDRIADPAFQLTRASKEEQMETLALLEIFTAARRMPELNELVIPMTKSWWEEVGGRTEFSKALRSWLLANRIGMFLTMPSEPKVLSSEIIEGVIAGLGDVASGMPADETLALPPSIATPKLAEKTKEGLLMDSVIQVVANSGAAAASMSRIARQAQVTTGTVYPRFGTNEELLIKSYEHAARDVTETNIAFATSAGFAPDQFGAIVIASMRPERETWRNFRIEMYLESKRNPSLLDHLKSTLQETNKRLVPGMALLPVNDAEREAILYLTHTIGIGMTVLLNNGIAVDKLDHAQATREMVAFLARLQGPSASLVTLLGESPRPYSGVK